MKIKLSTRGAFSLMEVLAGLVVCGIVMISLYAGISSGFKITEVARENLRATQVMVEKLETIRLYTFEQIETPGFIPPTFSEPYFAIGTNTGHLSYSGVVTISDADTDPAMPSDYSDDLKQVKIQISWTSGGVLRTREMSTLIARNGLQAYIY